MRDRLGRFEKGHKTDPEIELRRIASMRDSWKNRKDYIGDLKAKYPKLFNSWRSILYTKKSKQIGCDTKEWGNFRNFLEDVLPFYEEGKYLRRKDTSKPFGRDNFIWVSKEDFAYLQKNAVMLTYNGETLSLRDWALKLDISEHAMKNRYARYRKGLYTYEELFDNTTVRRGVKKQKDYSEVDSIRIKASKMVSSYKCKDKRLGLKGFDLTTNWLIENVLLKPCIYCGDTRRVGADRIDNTIGHTKKNIVPCCTECNTARNNNFTFEEMLKLGKTIAEIKAARGLVLQPDIDMRVALKETPQSERMRKYWSKQGRTIFQCDLKKNIVAEYKLVVEAAEMTGMNVKNISAACHGFRNHKYNGYLWYLNKIE